MRYGRGSRTSVALALALWGRATAAQGRGAFTDSLPFALFGEQGNFACGGKGACGAVSTVNSFIFLEKRYPKLYDNKLTPHYDAKTNTDRTDAQNFGFDGWRVPPNPMRQGYYNNRNGTGTGSATLNFLNTKMDWIGDYAPGTTRFDSWFAGSPNNNRVPTIADLDREVRDNEDTEFFVSGTNFFHVLLLTAVRCDARGMCGIRYQDPNAPTVNQPFTSVTVNDGMLQFTGVPGSGFAGAVTITAAFSESPVPEPSTWLLASTGLTALLAARWRRHGPPAARG